jgi:AraC-like DNA-binding protein
MTPRPLPREDRARIYAAKTYLLNNLHRMLKLEDVANIAGMSPYQFRYRFKEIFGFDFHSYMQESRMHTALVLLRHTDKSIKEIGLLSGYNRMQNFTRAFKKRFGMAPNKLREQFSTNG